jgi:CelD/BcsL family acetyltransferase involved in cellulose biosynthesis
MTPSTITLTEVDPGSDPLWADLCGDADVQLFASPPWARVLQRTYGMEVRALVGAAAGRPVTGMPFARLRDPRGRRISVLPFSDFCDPVGVDGEGWDRFVAALLEEGIVVQIRCLHSPYPRSDERFEEVGSARWHAVDVLGDVDRQWQEISSSARRAVRSARESGLEVREGTSREELRTFFELHLRVRKNKYHLVAQPFRFFEAIWDEFFKAGNGRILYAAHGGDMVAGVLFLEWRDAWYYKFNASDPAYLAHRPNDLILWTAIERATAAGVGRIDLGLSDADQEGLIRYKAKYAGSTGEISTLRATPQGYSRPKIAATWGRALGKATDALTRPGTPNGLTEFGGNVLYRFFA